MAKDGSLITLGPAIFGIHYADWTNVKQTQFLQEVPGELFIKIVKDPLYSDIDIKSYILRLFRARLEGRFKLQVRFVDSIPRTQSGKYKFLIQKLPIEFGD